MGEAGTSRDETARKARALYEGKIRAHVEPQHKGKFLALDVTTGEYEIDDDELQALHRARANNPRGVLYLLRVGHPVTYRLGATSRGWPTQGETVAIEGLP